MVTAKYNNYAYGDELNSTVTTGTDYRYTGKELDEESGFNLYNYGARFYDARIGRFVSADPKAEKYLGWSPYVYSHDNPITKFDPDGRAVFLVPAVAAGVEVGVSIALSAAALHTSLYATNPTYRAAVDATVASITDYMSGGGRSEKRFQGFLRESSTPLSLTGNQNKRVNPDPKKPGLVKIGTGLGLIGMGLKVAHDATDKGQSGEQNQGDGTASKDATITTQGNTASQSGQQKPQSGSQNSTDKDKKKKEEEKKKQIKKMLKEAAEKKMEEIDATNP